jgi:hypothetical protein
MEGKLAGLFLEAGTGLHAARLSSGFDPTNTDGETPQGIFMRDEVRAGQLHLRKFVVLGSLMAGLRINLKSFMKQQKCVRRLNRLKPLLGQKAPLYCNILIIQMHPNNT